MCDFPLLEEHLSCKMLETYRRFMLKEDVVLEVEIKKEKTGFFSFHFFFFQLMFTQSCSHLASGE